MLLLLLLLLEEVEVVAEMAGVVPEVVATCGAWAGGEEKRLDEEVAV